MEKLKRFLKKAVSKHFPVCRGYGHQALRASQPISALEQEKPRNCLNYASNCSSTIVELSSTIVLSQ
jgi:hypothetical protein